eukprot:353510-Chlamydomonas_euryale.AAC.8
MKVDVPVRIQNTLGLKHAAMDERVDALAKKASERGPGWLPARLTRTLRVQGRNGGRQAGV